MDESCLIGVFGVQHHDFFLLVAVLRKHLLFDLEVFLVERLSRVEVATRVETHRTDVLLVH